MNKTIFIALSIALGFFLTSCASISNTDTKTKYDPQSQAQAQLLWHTRQQQLLKVTDWHMQGRLVVVNGVELWSLSVDWQQRGEQYVIFLSGPFGAGKVQLVGSANGVLLKNSDDQIFYAETAEELLLEHTGVAMPLSYLRFWILGLQHPDSTNHNELFDQAGRLESLRFGLDNQLAWNVAFKRYITISTKKNNEPKISYELPDKIFINQGDDIKVRVVVGQWLFDNSEPQS